MILNEREVYFKSKEGKIFDSYESNVVFSGGFLGPCDKRFPEVLQASKIQNIAHIENPEVSRITGIKSCTGEFCQSIDGFPKKVFCDGKIKSIAEKYGFSIKESDGEEVNFYNCEFIRDYTQTIKDIYFKDGKYGKIYYQAVPELGLNGGPRKSLDRINYMQLEKVDFKDKWVLDIGCAGGFFCRYADNHGAKRVLGVDMEGPVFAAKHLANYLGNFNIDYEVVDLSKGYDTERIWDIVFFLSLNYHIDIPEVVKKAKMVIFEDNGKTTRNLTELGKPWTDWFNRIEFVGKGLDHGDKSVYHLYKE